MKIGINNLLKFFLVMLLPLMVVNGGAVLAADEYPAQPIQAKQRCPVCGMYTAQFPEWATQVVFKDRSMVAPESPAELFRFLGNVGKFDTRHTASDVAKIYVTDYTSRTWIDAKQAYYVRGSKQKGPMSADFPAFATQSHAENFAKEHGGKVMTFDALSSSEINDHSGHGGHTHGDNRK